MDIDPTDIVSRQIRDIILYILNKVKDKELSVPNAALEITNLFFSISSAYNTMKNIGQLFDK